MALQVCSNAFCKLGADWAICCAFAVVAEFAASENASSADSETLPANLMPVSRALRIAFTGATSVMAGARASRQPAVAISLCSDRRVVWLLLSANIEREKAEKADKAAKTEETVTPNG